MTRLVNLFRLSLCSALAIASFSSTAAMITFGGVEPLDGSQQTAGGDSRLSNIQWITGAGDATSDVTNIIDPSSGFFIETFDADTANPFLPSGLMPGDDLPSWVEFTGGRSAGCSVNSGNALTVSGTPVGAGLGVQKGNTGQAAHNNANDTCFAFAPQLGENANATVTIDYTDFFQGTAFEGESLGYVGLYYGSIDNYNSLRFGNIVDGVFEAIDIAGFGTELDGSEILDEFELQSGDRNNSNRFVNIFFDSSESFTALQFVNTQRRAFEVDNIIVGTRSAISVSGPSTIAVLGLGLVGLGWLSRRKPK